MTPTIKHQIQTVKLDKKLEEILRKPLVELEIGKFVPNCVVEVAHWRGQTSAGAWTPKMVKDIFHVCFTSVAFDTKRDRVIVIARNKKLAMEILDQKHLLPHYNIAMYEDEDGLARIKGWMRKRGMDDEDEGEEDDFSDENDANDGSVVAVTGSASQDSNLDSAPFFSQAVGISETGAAIGPGPMLATTTAASSSVGATKVDHKLRETVASTTNPSEPPHEPTLPVPHIDPSNASQRRRSNFSFEAYNRAYISVVRAAVAHRPSLSTIELVEAALNPAKPLSTTCVDDALTAALWSVADAADAAGPGEVGDDLHRAIFEAMAKEYQEFGSSGSHPWLLV
ncbi:hypothetical protein FRB90_004275 [Tulasnella sp. 427]|nr:hypothetical protein FRB90_004275 [Tulasnella sp. 427]